MAISYNKLLSTMCSALAERDAPFGRDVWLRQVMCASRVKSGITHFKRERKETPCGRMNRFGS